jgi:hypothetical protein
MPRSSYRMWCVALLLTFLIAPTGCGPDPKARGSVKGKVTVGKRALTAGTVMFHNKNGLTASAGIDPDGNYVCNDVPAGECRVTVTVPNLPNDPSVRARLKGKGPKMPEMKGPEGGDGPTTLPSSPTVPKEIVQIDQKYSDPEKSGLSVEVQKGESKEYNIQL